MDDSIKIIIDKGWREMSRKLDKQMPVTRFPHIRRYRHYYSAAMVLIMVFASIVWMNESSIVINSYQEYSAQNTIQNEASSKLKNNILKRALPDIEVVNTSEKSIQESEHAGDIKRQNIKNRKSEIANPLSNIKVIERRSSGLNTFNELLVIIGSRYDYLRENAEMADSEIVFNSVDNFRHNTLSVMVNSINEDLSSFGGVDGGINYAYRLNKNIGFMTGIEHSLLAMGTNDIDLQDMRRSDALLRSYEENIEMPTEGDATGNSELLHYVGIPVGFLYSISDFTISAGMKFSYLVNTPGLFTDNMNSEYAGIIAENEVSDDFSNIAYNRFDYSFILGFEFKIFKDFSLISRLNYSHSNLVNSYSYGENEIGNLFMVSGLENNIRDKLGRNMYFGIGVKYDLARR